MEEIKQTEGNKKDVKSWRFNKLLTFFWGELFLWQS